MSTVANNSYVWDLNQMVSKPDSVGTISVNDLLTERINKFAYTLYNLHEKTRKSQFEFLNGLKVPQFNLTLAFLLLPQYFNLYVKDPNISNIHINHVKDKYLKFVRDNLNNEQEWNI